MTADLSDRRTGRARPGLGGDAGRILVLADRWGPAGLVVAATVAVSIVCYLSWNTIFPDTQYYLAWTYRLMGYDDAVSQQVVIDYVRQGGVFQPYDHLWGSPLELSTKPRLLLPLLSIPFVKLFGPGGIVVVPGLAFLVAMYLIYRLARIHAGPWPAALATSLAASSTTMAHWAVGGLTDSLAMMLHAAMLLVLPWRRPASWGRVAAVGGLAALAATARVITPFTAAAIAGVWLWAMWRRKGERLSWTFTAFGAAVGTVVGYLWTRWLTTGITTEMYFYLISNGAIKTRHDRVVWYLANVPGRAATELHTIMFSPALAAVVVLSLVACVTARRTVVPWLVAGGWVGSVGIFLLNPAPTDFRYEMPMLPGLVVAVAVLLGQAAELVRRWRRPASHGFEPLGATIVAPRVPSQRAAAQPAPSPEAVR